MTNSASAWMRRRWPRCCTVCTPNAATSRWAQRSNVNGNGRKLRDNAARRARGSGDVVAQHVSNVYFGLSPMWVATCILLVTYGVIISEKINRSIVALIGAGAMVLVGVM